MTDGVIGSSIQIVEYLYITVSAEGYNLLQVFGCFCHGHRLRIGGIGSDVRIIV